MQELTNSELLPSWWDESYYLYKNPDVAAEVKKGLLESGYKHFVEYGIKEGRDPNSGFNTQYYLDKNRDVAEAVRNGSLESAFQHWLLYGQQENRKATPDGIIIPQNKLDGIEELASKDNQKLDKNLATSQLNQSFGWVGENALTPERLQNHLPTCECIGCRSLVVNDELMVPNNLVGKANPLTSLPLLSSNPSATAKIFLDFDGHITSNTAWNYNFTGGANIFTPAYSIDSDTNSFSDQEIANIEEIWKQVAEDFAPFNVDVTTIDPGNLNQSNNMRVAIGGSWQNWYGSSAGGVAYINSWQWNSDTPTFVFEDNLANGFTKYTAEAISHEVGHTLGLYHQSTYDAFGNKTAEYNPGGLDSYGISWAPIMGVSYYNSLTTWHNGQNSQGYNIYQDDLAVITRPSNGFGYRLDDHGNTNNTATVLSGNPTISTSGIISTTNDVDVFSFTTGAGQISLNANGAEFSPNLDVIAELWNSSGTLIASSNPAELLSANITASVPPGNFFLHIKSNELYGRIGQYNISGTINPVTVAGEIRGLKWNDLDGDSTRDPEEPGLSGWTIYLDRNRNGVLDTGETSATTDSSGNYAFTGLAAGTYTVAEVMQDGWEQTYPNVSEDSSTEPIAISTTNSPVPISTYGEIVKSSTDEEINPLTDVSGPLINLNDFRADPRFAGINGNGFSTVILDTGIDLNHSYFGPDANSDGVADRIVYQYDFADGDADASDRDGHGSNVSSIVASSDSVHTGMAPGADIIHLKVFKDIGDGNFGYVEQALQWVVANADTYNIASVNMSLGDGENWNTNQTLYGISDEIAALAAKDVMVVSAAGNGFYEFGSTPGVSYPAADPNSLAVGAAYDSNAGGFMYGSGAQAYTTGADRIAPFSQRHSTLTSIFAPGAPITGAGPTGGTVTIHGTSQAAPHIAGIAALAQQLAEQTIDRRLTLDEFQNLLSTTGVTINDGDDEDDNVVNTGLNFKRVDMMALGEAILAMDGDTPPGTHTVHLNPGEVVTGKDFGNKFSDDSSPFIDSQCSNWTVQATKDFNGDGKGDIFWRDESNGNNQLWLMNGRTVSSSENINALCSNCEVQGVNDFNGDSKADILWRDPATGQNTLWLMDGATVDSATVINPADVNWQVEATDDFNGDGKADIFWHDPVTGQNALWLMNGSTRIDSGNFSGARTAWQVEATDDFNGDGKADILWRNPSTGQNSIWLMDGLSVITGRNITGAQLNWEVESTDDFNADGKADIVWRKATTGENQVWLVDGTTVTSLENISSAASNWQIQGTSDFNNDSNSDILWRDPATGRNAMWLMNGLNNPTGPLLV